MARTSASKRSHSRHKFSQTPSANIPRSSFDRSHTHKTTIDAGRLIPLFWDEVIPGDTFNAKASVFARLATPIKPFMDNLWVDLHWFFVPYRQIWDNFRKFMGEQVNPGDSIDYTVPQVTLTSVGTGTIYDYMGIPTGQAANLSVSALPFRAYVHIYNEWYRDQNMVQTVPFPTDDGPDPASYPLIRRGKRHDYFTSAMPFPQKGDPVLLPLGQEAPVMVRESEVTAGNLVNLEGDTSANSYSLQYPGTPGIQWTGGSNPMVGEGDLYADLANATASTVNQIREAFQIQKLLERDARGGTRYAEVVRSHFGVEFFDVTYRPEYLGGGTMPVSITPVPQMGATGTDTSIIATPQANLSGYGVASGVNHGFTKSFTEHGIVMGLISVRADYTYQQGIERAFNRQTRYDFYWPALAHLGEQAILNKEIYALGSNGTTDDEVFGYIPRYDEYRYKPSRISGLFRSTSTTPLDFWHLAQDFESLPALDATFIQENPPIDRVIATPEEPHFLVDSRINLLCARPMPVRAVPGLIDHF